MKYCHLKVLWKNNELCQQIAMIFIRKQPIRQFNLKIKIISNSKYFSNELFNMKF